jgi:hypothetical protein
MSLSSVPATGADAGTGAQILSTPFPTTPTRNVYVEYKQTESSAGLRGCIPVLCRFFRRSEKRKLSRRIWAKQRRNMMRIRVKRELLWRTGLCLEKIIHPNHKTEFGNVGEVLMTF